MSTSFWAFAVALAVLLPSGTEKGGGRAAKQPGKRPALKLEKWLEEKLTAGEEVDPVWGTPCKEYLIECKRDQTYVIDLEARSKDFDPYLRLKDQQGRQWASDDDGGQGF